MIIQHNIPALNAHRQLGINNGNTSKTLEKLSSGYRINRAGDDAAGLAISEKMRGQIRGLSMAEQNVSHGINLIQTAEGGLQETHDILQRMRELAVQSSNGTYDDPNDRANLDKEFQALMEEIDRIADSTHYNGIKLLDGSLEGGAGKTSWGSGSSGAVSGLTQTGKAINWSSIGGKDYTALVADIAGTMVPNIVDQMLGMDSLASFAGSNFSLGLNYSRGTSYDGLMSFSWRQDSAGNSQIELSMTINLDFVDSVWKGGNYIGDGRARLEALLAHELTHAVMDVTTTMGMTSSTGDGYPSWFKEGMAQAMSGDMSWVSHLTAQSTDAEIRNLLNFNTLIANSPQSHYASGYLAVLYLAHKAESEVFGTGNIDSPDLLRGIDVIMAELISGTSLDQVIGKYTDYEGLYEFEKSMGNQKEVYDFVRALRGATYDTVNSRWGSGSVLGSSLTEVDFVIDTTPTPSNIDPFLKMEAGYTSMINKFSGGAYNIMNGGGAYKEGKGPVDSGYTTPNNNDLLDKITNMRTPGERANPNPYRGSLVLQIGANGKLDQLLILTIAKMNSESIGSQRVEGMAGKSVRDVDVATQDTANEAIDVLDNAINMVSAERANLGAAQNRLEHTLNNLGVTRENLTAAESTIRDADMAKEMMDYTKNSILVQSAQAMLAQAQTLPQGVLSLLR